MTRLTFMTVFLIICSCLLAGSGSAQNPLRPQDIKPCPDPPHSPFRYVITRNAITEGSYYPQGEKFRERGVDVLLDEKSFSESTLRQLFALISKRFPEPTKMYVNVYTSLDDMLTPEEGEHIAINCTLDLTTLKFPPALYTREIEHERFVYQTKEQSGVMKTIVLRSKK
jgi:hypothetical protein